MAITTQNFTTFVRNQVAAMQAAAKTALGVAWANRIAIAAQLLRDCRSAFEGLEDAITGLGHRLVHKAHLYDVIREVLVEYGCVAKTEGEFVHVGSMVREFLDDLVARAAPKPEQHSKQGTNMLQFRKKPIVIEAFQMTEARRLDNSDWPNWLNQAWNKNEGQEGALFRQNMGAQLPDLLCIQTLEGVHLVQWGDWIIRGVKGELYPCKPDIFEATYEPADAAPAAPGVTDELRSFLACEIEATLFENVVSPALDRFLQAKGEGK